MTNHLLPMTVTCNIINVLTCTYVADPSQSVLKPLPDFLLSETPEQHHTALISR